MNQPQIKKNFMFVRNCVIVVMAVFYLIGCGLYDNMQHVWYFIAVILYEGTIRFVCWFRGNSLADMENPYFENDRPV